MECIEKTLQDVCDYLIESKLIISSDNEDGRINSVINETEILNCLSNSNLFDIQIPRSRHWADCYINNEPVNVKTTAGLSADNASSKQGVCYSLTGIIHSNCNNWEKYLKFLHENIKETDTDYRYLVFNKVTGNVFYQSLKTIKTLTSNGSNLPFQINWKNNQFPDIVEHDIAESRILTAFGKSMRLSNKKVESWLRYFPEYYD